MSCPHPEVKPHEQAEWLALVEALDLPKSHACRLHMVLYWCGVRKLADLPKLTQTEVLKFKSVGPKKCQVLVDACARNGITILRGFGVPAERVPLTMVVNRTSVERRQLDAIGELLTEAGMPDGCDGDRSPLARVRFALSELRVRSDRVAALEAHLSTAELLGIEPLRKAP